MWFPFLSSQSFSFFSNYHYERPAFPCCLQCYIAYPLLALLCPFVSRGLLSCLLLPAHVYSVLMFLCCLSSVACILLLAFVHPLSMFLCCLSFTACPLLPFPWCLPSTACRLLPIACCLSSVVCRLFSVACPLLPVLCCLSSDACRLSPVASPLLPVLHHRQSTLHSCLPHVLSCLTSFEWLWMRTLSFFSLNLLLIKNQNVLFLPAKECY